MKTIIILALIEISCPQHKEGCLVLHQKAVEKDRFTMTAVSAYEYLKGKDYIEENDTIRVFLGNERTK